jgi:hypothetical protein
MQRAIGLLRATPRSDISTLKSLIQQEFGFGGLQSKTPQLLSPFHVLHWHAG